MLGRLKYIFFVTLRIKKYGWLSNCKNTSGNPDIYTPLLLKGMGSIAFGQNVQIGVIASPLYYNSYCYLEARNTGSKISIGRNTAINNGFSAIALSNITIGDNVLIGTGCTIMDSDMHHLDPRKRNDHDPPSLPVFIKDNVFIGSGSTILKGVTIGENSVVGCNSVVTKNVPANCIVAGNPAKFIKELQ